MVDQRDEKLNVNVFNLMIFLGRCRLCPHADHSIS